MLQKIFNVFLNPYPHRTFIIGLAKKYKLGNYAQRLRIGAVERPHYGYCVYNSAKLAVRLGVNQISILEFGVAGGNGLINLEYHAKEIEKIIPIKINIFGFDTGSGLPKPMDYRDLPHRFAENAYKMDIPVLKANLQKAVLVLGNVKDTVTTFFNEFNPAPIAAIMFDLDFYSSTVEALKVFDADEKYFLPRVFCYFDDILGTEVELYNDYVGERLAIREFNDIRATKKISIPYHLHKHRVVEKWHHRIFIYHNFAHSQYNNFIGTENPMNLSFDEG
jgi:hypothetical protein